MILYIAANADSRKIAEELLRHGNLSLETRTSIDSQKIRKFVQMQNDNPKIQSWTMFRVEVLENSVDQIIGS